MIKLKQNVSVKTIDRSLKYQYPVQWSCKSTIFLCDYMVMDLNSLFLDAIDRKAIKLWADSYHQNCLSNNGIMSKTN